MGAACGCAPTPCGCGSTEGSQGDRANEAPDRRSSSSGPALGLPGLKPRSRVRLFHDIRRWHPGCDDPLCEICLESAGGRLAERIRSNRERRKTGGDATPRGTAGRGASERGTSTHGRGIGYDSTTGGSSGESTGVGGPSERTPCLGARTPGVIERKVRYTNADGEVFKFRVTQPEHTVGDFGDVIDEAVFKYLLLHDIPNASVGILAGDGRLVYARGFTNITFFTKHDIDIDEAGCAEPDSVYRIASLTKPITATAVFQLIERGLLSLDSYFMDVLSPLPYDLSFLPPYVMVRNWDSSWAPEPRFLGDITIQDLLRHTSGWCDRESGAGACPEVAVKERTGRPYGINITRDDRANAATGIPFPLEPWAGVYAAFCVDGLPTKNTTWYWGLSESGTRIGGKSESRFHYSNLGYRLLGYVVREVSGKPWETFLRENIFEPLGMSRTGVGGTTLAERLEHEVIYYPSDFNSNPKSVLSPDRDDNAPPQYGGTYNLGNLIGEAALTSTVPDYLRFLDALRRNRSFGNILSMTSIRTMQDEGSVANSSYSHGWFIDLFHPEYDGKKYMGGGMGGVASVHPVAHGGTLSGVWTGFYRLANESAQCPEWQNCAVVAFCNRTVADEDSPRLHDSIVALITSHVVQGTNITVPSMVSNWGSLSLPGNDLWYIFA